MNINVTQDQLSALTWKVSQYNRVNGTNLSVEEFVGAVLVGNSTNDFKRERVELGRASREREAIDEALDAADPTDPDSVKAKVDEAFAKLAASSTPPSDPLPVLPNPLL